MQTPKPFSGLESGLVTVNGTPIVSEVLSVEARVANGDFVRMVDLMMPYDIGHVAVEGSLQRDPYTGAFPSGEHQPLY